MRTMDIAFLLLLLQIAFVPLRQVRFVLRSETFKLTGYGLDVCRLHDTRRSCPV